MRTDWLLLALIVSTNAPYAAAASDTSKDLPVSGGMTVNADGSASFEFRLDNALGNAPAENVTVTVIFYGSASTAKAQVGNYHWTFSGPVPAHSQLLEYGRLDAAAVSALTQEYQKLTPGFKREELEFVSYSYSAKLNRPGG